MESGRNRRLSLWLLEKRWRLRWSWKCVCVDVGAYEIHYCRAIYVSLQMTVCSYISFSCDKQYFAGLWDFPFQSLHITRPLGRKYSTRKAESDLFEGLPHRVRLSPFALGMRLVSRCGAIPAWPSLFRNRVQPPTRLCSLTRPPFYERTNN